MLNVLYIILNLGQGGAERVVIDLAKTLDRSRFNPTVCCLYDKGPFAEELERENIKVIALNKKRRVELSIIKKLIGIIRENDIHIVHTHLWGPNFWGRIAAKIAKTPVIIATEHNEDTWKSKFYFLLDKWLFHWTDRVIAVSNGVKKFYVNKAGLDAKKIEVIHNGINVNKEEGNQFSISRLKKELGIKGDESVLAVIGRLVPQKGHRYFLMALKELLAKYRIRGLIIGSGPLEQELKEFSQNLGLQNNVIFTGFRQDVPNLLKAIDVLVMPSLREGLPITSLEAMAVGVPVVATKVGGTPEVIIDGQTGILVAPNSHTALKEGISRLIDNSNLSPQIINNAKTRIKAEFSIAKMVNTTERLYEELYKRKTGIQ